MRAPTAFFLFSEEQREQTRAECIAAAEPGAKISVATVAKAVGEKWRALSNLEKAAYQEKQIQRAAELAASAKADAEAKAGSPSTSNILPPPLQYAVCQRLSMCYLRKWVHRHWIRKPRLFMEAYVSALSNRSRTRKQRVTAPRTAKSSAEQDASVIQLLLVLGPWSFEAKQWSAKQRSLSHSSLWLM